MALTGSYRFAKIFICGSLIISSTAANASASLDPWAALSAFGTQSSRSAACSAATVGAAAAVAAQGPGSGCVLPVTDPPPPPPPVVQNVPVPPPPLETAGFGVSPLLLALGALAVAGLIYLVVKGDNDDEDSLSPQ